MLSIELQFLSSVLSLQVMEHCIKQNNAIDIYEEYFEDQDSVEDMQECPSAKTINIFRCPSHQPPPNTHTSTNHSGSSRKTFVFVSLLPIITYSNIIHIKGKLFHHINI